MLGCSPLPCLWTTSSASGLNWWTVGVFPLQHFQRYLSMLGPFLHKDMLLPHLNKAFLSLKVHFLVEIVCLFHGQKTGIQRTMCLETPHEHNYNVKFACVWNISYRRFLILHSSLLGHISASQHEHNYNVKFARVCETVLIGVFLSYIPLLLHITASQHEHNYNVKFARVSAKQFL
jgi:hypothetical protein